jgi:hypothetical protein
VSAFSGSLQLDFGDWGKDVGRIAILLAPITWRGITVPKGFMTDGASMPRPLWWFLPPWGDRATVAAVFHDFACEALKAGAAVVDGENRPACDRLFRLALSDLGVAAWRCWLCYFGVRAYSNWEKACSRF